jgi:hypothetical protein
MEVVLSGRENRAAQARLTERLEAALPDVETAIISFRPTTISLPVHHGAGGLWWTCQELTDEEVGTPRFWNAFGNYQREATQKIDLEINIRTTKKGRSQGFFARDTRTGALLLMHSGVMGGGKEGCTRAALLEWLDRPVVHSSLPDGKQRAGLVIGSLEDPALVDRISSFVREVRRFKRSLDE